MQSITGLLNNNLEVSKKKSLMFWMIAFLVGIISGLAAVSFRWAISSFQELFYRANEQSLLLRDYTTHWIWFLIIPILGSLTVGLVLYFFCDEERNGSVADVIEGAALNNGRVNLKFGIISTEFCKRPRGIHEVLGVEISQAPF